MAIRFQALMATTAKFRSARSLPSKGWGTRAKPASGAGGAGVEDVGGDVGVGDAGDGLGPLEGGAFAVGVERALAPGGEAVEALLGLAGGAGVLRVHVDAVGAAVHLAGAELDQEEERLFEVRAVQVGLEGEEGLEAF